MIEPSCSRCVNRKTLLCGWKQLMGVKSRKWVTWFDNWKCIDFVKSYMQAPTAVMVRIAVTAIRVGEQTVTAQRGSVLHPWPRSRRIRSGTLNMAHYCRRESVNIAVIRRIRPLVDVYFSHTYRVQPFRVIKKEIYFWKKKCYCPSFIRSFIGLYNKCFHSYKRNEDVLFAFIWKLMPAVRCFMQQGRFVGRCICEKRKMSAYSASVIVSSGYRFFFYFFMRNNFLLLDLFTIIVRNLGWL